MNSANNKNRLIFGITLNQINDFQLLYRVLGTV